MILRVVATHTNKAVSLCPHFSVAIVGYPNAWRETMMVFSKANGIINGSVDNVTYFVVTCSILITSSKRFAYV